ncbi:hypothetical protein EBN88_03310 [Streptomyces triticirhizae]|uniref:Uncharacterized protein n=1 Tax=Streptomyces triticirhizae TaxID=2483353 RepID=A0A3M2M6G6_9ACTN|nr:hypothetical protein EBN88_03310 [Streptomyces triticirhizae]
MPRRAALRAETFVGRLADAIHAAVQDDLSLCGTASPSVLDEKQHEAEAAEAAARLVPLRRTAERKSEAHTHPISTSAHATLTPAASQRRIR